MMTNTSTEGLLRAFPFFLAWDESDVIVSAGPSLAKYCPRAKIGARTQEVFLLRRPSGLLSTEFARQNSSALFILEDRENGRVLRGSLLFLESPRSIVMLATPWITSPAQLLEYGLTLDDLGVQDQTLDMLQLLQTQEVAAEDLKRLNRMLTEQRAKLHEQEAQSRKLALVASRTDNAVIVTDATGRIEWVNDAFTRITGWRAGEVAGRKPGEFLQGPETDPKVARFMSEELRAGRGFTVKLINYRRSGEKFWFAIEVQPLFNEAGELTNFMAIESDITERKESEEAIQKYRQHLEEIVEERTRELQRNKFLLEAIVKSSPNGILLIDDQGRIKMTNAALDRMFGYGGSELLGRRVEMLVPQPLREEHALLQGAFPGGPSARPMGENADLHGQRKDGSIFPIDVALASFTVGDEQFVQATVADVTDRKRAESAWRELNATLEHKVEERTLELAAASAAKSEFLANMSHEIRTPMNGMLGLAQLLEREPLSEDQLTVVRRLRQAGQSLLGILNDILDFSKIEAGHLRLDPRPFELPPMLAQISSLLGVTAHEKGLNFHLDDPPLLSGALIGDALRLEQVLMNLLGNAIKFTERGAIDLRIQALSVTASHVRLRFEIKDTGIGISPQQLAGLFTPFTQADGAITRRFGGTGLGLSICKRLVELMHGEIGVESAPGAGSTFWFEAVFERSVERQATSLAPAPPAFECATRLSGLRCLVVDDSRMNREVVQRMLMHEGARAVLAGDGQQALQYLSAQNEAFDAVLMDVQMPVMDGLAATRAIREKLGLVDLPIIALTAGVLDEQRRQVLEAGADDFLAKPVDMDALVDVLLRFAGSRLRPPEASPTLPRIRGVDSEQALLMLGGDQDLFLQLLQSFVTEFAATPEEVRETLDRGDRRRAADLLHAFRGAAGYIGAGDSAQAAEMLEHSIRGDRSDLAFRVTAFETLASVLLEGARAHLASSGQGEDVRC
ncbi:PAS domain S-box protein [Methylocystis bryophila]|nr:PAS domain S-box protein [Methylocystis bryophila]